MGKKGRSKPKPLLSVNGILHLQNSFVHPQEESGLLATVGGTKLTPFTLEDGYGKEEEASISHEKGHQPQEASGFSTTARGTEKSPISIGDEGEKGDEDTSQENIQPKQVNGLSATVGVGGKEQKQNTDLPHGQGEEEASISHEKTKSQSESCLTESLADFYKTCFSSTSYDPENVNENNNTSINNNDKMQAESSSSEQAQTVATHLEKSNDIISQTASIADYYKTYCKYYYSVTPDPLSSTPLDFSTAIDSTCDSNTDESVIEAARMAQKARRAMDVAIAQKRAEAERLKKEEESRALAEIDAFDPLPMEIVESEYEVVSITSDTTLTQYWDYVKENPHDFNRWIYLIHYVESIANLAECRKVYSAFLPIFPYCFGYWKRYAEIEKAHHYINRALSILSRGLDFTPLSIDLWLSYLNLFSEIHAHDPNCEELIREKFSRGLRTLGLDFKSDAYWEAYIQWENVQSNMKNVFAIYRKLVQVPTRLYNRHCDNIKALIRDHHPRDFLSKSEYERLRKRGCKILKFKYKEEPELEPGEIRKTSKPEDKLMAYVKEILLEKIESQHKKTENEVDKRWEYEDKIKRPYFHVKALDKRQLKNWDDYLRFEVQEANHDRIVLLFERCITTCAHYEYYWCKYARYLEAYHKKNTKEISVHFQKSQINVELVSNKETEEEESRISAALSVVEGLISEIENDEMHKLESDVRAVIDNLIEQVSDQCLDEVPVITLQDLLIDDIAEKVKLLSSMQDDNRKAAGVTSVNLDGHSCWMANNELPPKPEEPKTNESSLSGYTSLLSVPTFPPTTYRWQEVVRDIYKRGSIVHCPRKPTIRLQWAAYEEELGNKDEARQLIKYVLEWYPDLLDAKLLMLEYERRNGSHESLMKLYDGYLSNMRSYEAFSIVSLKYARFLFKEAGKPDKALMVLRKAVTRDKGNIKIYLAIYGICFERFPSDRKGALASLELAIQSKHLTDEEKLVFLKKKLLFLQDHGDLARYRDAIDQCSECQEKVNLAKEEELKLKAYEVPSRFEAQKSSEHTTLHPFPIPAWPKSRSDGSQNTQKPVPINFESTTDTNHVGNKSDVEKAGPEDDYTSVPPTRELLVTSDYGYSYRHPDQKIIDHMGHKHYETLETKGYPEHLKNKEGESSSNKKRKAETPLYIVAPKGSLIMSYLGGPNNADNPPVPGGVYLEGVGNKRMKLESPMEMTTLLLPTNAPCINIPDWFVKEGGELCLSETNRGFSILRYWPHFLTEAGDKKMFKSVRKAVKWHQKQILVGGRWRHIPRLISWLGPCDYSHNGMVIEKNEDWPPEILDLLHRLIRLTHYEFNSCSLNLYRSGHDSNAWHSDVHKALGSNPPVASVSLGSLRYFEMRKKGYEQNFIRFPLFPGSLLLMEGATQEDWVHQVPKDPSIKEERVNLTFRIMHAIELDESVTPNTVTPVVSQSLVGDVTKQVLVPASTKQVLFSSVSSSISKAVDSNIKSLTPGEKRKAEDPVTNNDKSYSSSEGSSAPRISYRSTYCKASNKIIPNENNSKH